MVSSVLAKAILNQDAPDILGAFKEGQQEVRQEKARELAGQAISSGKIDPLLAELNPEIAFAVGEQIRARSAQDISDFLRDAQIAKAKLDSGDVQGAMQFTNQRIQAIENRGGDSSNSRAFAQTLSNSPEDARQELNALLGSIEQTSASMREFSSLTEGLSPEEQEKAKRIRLGLVPRAATSAQERLARDRDLASDVASTQSLIEGSKAGAKEQAQLSVQRRMKPEVESAVTFAKEQAKQAIKDKTIAKSDTKALNVYESAVNGLLEDFGEATTGAFAGFIPAIGGDERVLEASINIMRPVVKGVVREAGEGTFTDQDQKLIDELIPSRRDSDDVARRKIERLDGFIRTRLSNADTSKIQPRRSDSEPQGATAPPATGGIKFLGFE